MARVQVEASVTRPEAGVTTQTNTFNFQFVFDLRRDGQGNLILPRRILPASGARQGPGTVLGRGGKGEHGGEDPPARLSGSVRGRAGAGLAGL